VWLGYDLKFRLLLLLLFISFTQNGSTSSQFYYSFLGPKLSMCFLAISLVFLVVDIDHAMAWVARERHKAWIKPFNGPRNALKTIHMQELRLREAMLCVLQRFSISFINRICVLLYYCDLCNISVFPFIF
jgi:hypothetical protein